MKDQPSTIACFGEMLWDLLPSGDVPGGAPMNVAYHLHRLGFQPGVITRVGTDARGRQLIRILEAQAIDTSNIQLDEHVQTGIVNATRSPNGDMKYDIVAPAAWDHVRMTDELEALVKSCNYFVFGSLVTRHQESRATLLQLLRVANQRVLDINLRPPFIDKQVIDELLTVASIVKMNEDELKLINSWNHNHRSLEQQMHWLAAHFNIPELIITRGADGCAALVNGEIYTHGGFRVRVADTVGSGDAFLAGYLASRIKEVEIPERLNFASGLGAFVAQHYGAWPAYDGAETIRSFINEARS